MDSNPLATAPEAARTCYERQTARLRDNGYTGILPEWTALPWHPVPLPDAPSGYGKRKTGSDNFLPPSPPPSINQSAETFSDYLIETDGDPVPWLPLVAEAAAAGRHCYWLVRENPDWPAFLQLPMAEVFFTGTTVLFSREELAGYLQQSGAYLPWHRAAGTTAEVDDLGNWLETLHQQRLRRDVRRGNRVLLTIAIPSFNRGHRAYQGVLRGLACRFDEEIEILVSDNASEKYQTEYRRIAAIADSRVTYRRNPENRLFDGNLMTVMTEAAGKFVLLVSDEDAVNGGDLEYLLEQLRGQENRLAFLRTSVSAIRYSRQVFRRGAEAATHGILQNNYLSGAVYNQAMYGNGGVADYLRRHTDNEVCRAYPHLVMDLLMSQLGDVEFSDLVTCTHGEPEPDVDVSTYQTPEKRLKQHQAWIAIFGDVIEQYRLDRETVAAMLVLLIQKNCYLLQVNRYCDKEYHTEACYFDSLMALYQLVVTDNLPRYRKWFGEELPAEVRQRIRLEFMRALRKVNF